MLRRPSGLWVPDYSERRFCSMTSGLGLSQSGLTLSSGKRGAVAPTYSGPGDVVTSALAWYGLRAYNSAYATGSNPGLDLHKDSDGSFTATINILATGALDVATAAIVIAGGSSKVGRIYDQVGTKHAVQATLANQPTLALNVYGSLPALVFAGGQNLTAPNYAASVPTYTISVLGERTGAFTSFGDLWGDTGTTPQIGFNNTANTMFVYEGTVVTFASNNDNARHAVQACFAAGPTASVYIDGVDSGAINPGYVPLLTTAAAVLGSGNNSLTGRLLEGGVWPITFNATQKSNMNANQHTYWGF